MTAGDALFDMTPAVPVLPEPERESPDRRRTRLQRQRIAQGLHPLAAILPGLRLHPDVRGNAIDRELTGPTCGTCQHRTPAGFRDWPKCTRLPDLMHRSAASDCRAWWPACTEWQETS